MSKPSAILKILSAPIWFPLMLIVKYHFFILKMIFWGIVAALLFSSCSFVINLDWASPDHYKDAQIAQARYGKYTLHVPPVFGNAGAGDYPTELQTMYPGGDALEAPPAEMQENGDDRKIIQTRIDYYPQSKMTFSKFLDHQVASSGAFENAGEAYGLEHLTQPSGGEGDKDDLWVERDEAGEPVSFIQCAEAQAEHPVSYCEQYFMLEPKLRVTVQYDRDYLPEWRVIKANVNELLESFRSRKAAYDYCLSKADEARCKGDGL